MVYNILAINNINYLKIAFSNINSFHRLDGGKQIFKLYIDKNGEKFFKEKINRLKYINKVSYKIFDVDDYWQKNKIKIYEDYHLKEDFIILDADSIWYSLPKIYDDKITFLNVSHNLNQNPFTKDNLKKILSLDNNIKENMTNNQMGFLHIPLKTQYENLLNEWNKLCDQLYNLEGVDGGVNRQCEQLAISILTQKNQIPLNFLKQRKNPIHDKKIIQSLYWSCHGVNTKNSHLKQNGW